jgi:carbonic anhydrase
VSTINTLLAGFKAFKAHYFEQRPRLFRFLTERGQQPDTMMIACSDSRVDPAILVNAEPGELFVARNVANLVPPYQPDSNYHGTSSALEFAVRDLRVRHIVVLGHSQCGGIAALRRFQVEGLPGRDFIAPWVSIAETALGRATRAEDNGPVERAAIQVSLRNLLSFPWIAERVSRGELDLHGWWFDMEAGELWGTQSPDAAFTQLG